MTHCLRMIADSPRPAVRLDVQQQSRPALHRSNAADASSCDIAAKNVRNATGQATRSRASSQPSSDRRLLLALLFALCVCVCLYMLLCATVVCCVRGDCFLIFIASRECSLCM